MEFNFNKVKKENLHLVLADGSSLTLRPPRYGSLKKFVRLGADVDEQQALELVAEILSENIEKKKITVQDVDELFDLSDLSTFIELYMKYLDQITNQKN